MINDQIRVVSGNCYVNPGRPGPRGPTGPQGPRGDASLLPPSVTNKPPYTLVRKLGLVTTDNEILTLNPLTNIIEIAAEILIISLAAGSMSLTIAWTDENGVPHTGNFIPNGGGPVTGPGVFCYQNFPLMITAGSTVTVSAVVNTGPAVYDFGLIVLEFTA